MQGPPNDCFSATEANPKLCTRSRGSLRQPFLAERTHVLDTGNKVIVYDDEPLCVLQYQFPRRLSLTHRPVSLIHRTVVA